MSVVAGQEDRSLLGRAALGRGEPERAQDARRARAEDRGHAQLVGDRGGVQRAGTAERQQREAARIDALLDGHDSQRADHLGVRDADDALGAGDRLERELVREPGHGALRGVAIEGDAAGKRAPGVEAAEQEVRVGDRRLHSAAPVTRRSGLRARAARPHPQRAARIAPGNRAAARADGVDVDHREGEGPPADLAGWVRRRLAHDAARDDADVARRAAHVEADEVGVAGVAGDERRGGRAPGGTGEDGEGGVAGRQIRGGEAAA